MRGSDADRRSFPFRIPARLFWNHDHAHISRCAKCHNLVEHDTNLLLLSDGSPVCENCSYICSVCTKPIHNEAIVTGTPPHMHLTPTHYPVQVLTLECVFAC